MIPPWIADYVGIPFVPFGRDRHGCDCWGLARLVIGERTGIWLPSYDGRYAGAGRTDAAELGRLIDTERALLDVVQVPRGAERLFDLVVLRTFGQPCHIGVVVAQGWALHVEEGVDTVLADLTESRWVHRVLGIYRASEAACRAS